MTLSSTDEERFCLEATCGGETLHQVWRMRDEPGSKIVAEHAICKEQRRDASGEIVAVPLWE